MRFLIVVLVLSISAGMAMSAPVEWPVSEGGNGHYYEMQPIAIGTWLDQHNAALSLEFGGWQGHLATITSAGELAWITQHFLSPYPQNTHLFFLGGWNDQFYTGSPCPGTWHWITGEPWNFAPWAANEPSSCNGGQPDEYALSYFFHYPQTGFNDLAFEFYFPNGSTLVEYDGLALSDLPPLDHPIPAQSSTWGEIKALYR
jgi:hypothetical protein